MTKTEAERIINKWVKLNNPANWSNLEFPRSITNCFAKTFDDTFVFTACDHGKYFIGSRDDIEGKKVAAGHPFSYVIK